MALPQLASVWLAPPVLAGIGEGKALALGGCGGREGEG